MCERLEIRIIAANSPQAKGRVERNNGVHQDRLVKKLRRKGIQDYQAANAYLEADCAARLREVFRLDTERWISNDWVVQYRGHFLQLKPQNRRYGPTQSKALICEWEDGAVEVRYRNKRIEYEDLVLRPGVVTAAKARAQRDPAQPRRSKPALNHPWQEGP
jgi:hypothetical protein